MNNEEIISVFGGSGRIYEGLHRRFASAKVHGEWFHLTTELNQFIRECAHE